MSLLGDALMRIEKAARREPMLLEIIDDPLQPATPGADAPATASAPEATCGTPKESVGKTFVNAASTASLLAAVGVGGYFAMPVMSATALPVLATTSPVVAPLPESVPPAADTDLHDRYPRTEARPLRLPSPGNTVTTGTEAPATENPLRITLTEARINPLLTHAFDALAAGNLADARTGYSEVLGSEPRNIDALLGMAAIAIRQQQHESAMEFYRQALESDPGNALALAGLVGLRSPGNVTNLESRLKSQIAAQPEQHMLHFALGNLYVVNGRWHEAQLSFFKAHSGDPQHPDYLFNLAVSLDHLHQPSLAAKFYAYALTAAADRVAGFDPTQAAARLLELQP